MNVSVRTIARILLASTVTAACGDDPSDSTGEVTTSGSSSSGNEASTTGHAESSGPGTSSTGAAESSETGASTSTTGAVENPRVLSGFSVPESAHWHPASQTWFVSNIAGETGVADGEGWITRLDAELEVVEERWLDGLDSPAGLVSSERMLYVADLDRVLAIDIETGTVEETWTIPGAGLLNDPTLHADGTLFVSDTFANAVFALRSTELPTVVVQDAALMGPNGLAVRGDTLLIVSTGSFTDFERLAPAFRYDLQSNTLETIDGLTGKFDGIELDGDAALITDFRGTLLRLRADDEVESIRDFVAEGFVTSTADLGYDPQLGRVLIPDLFGDQVLVYDLATSN